jgi:hypothetical protein
VAPYALEVRVDGRPLVAGRVAGSDESGEGTLYVLHEFPLEVGSHRVQVRFAREVGADSVAPIADRRRDVEKDEARSPRGRRRHTVPSLLVLDTAITLPAGRVALVTYSSEQERLVLVGGESAVSARQP